MSSAVSRRARIAAIAVVGALLCAAEARAAADRPDTTTAVSPRVLLAAPDRSPVDFPGIRNVRAGEPLPAAWTVVARDLRITRGGEIAYAALRMACPRGKTWRAGASRGALDVSVLDRVVTKKRSVLVMASLDTRRTAVGETAAGTLYALCR